MQLKRTNFKSEPIMLYSTFAVRGGLKCCYFTKKKRKRYSPNGNGSFRVSARHPRRVLGRSFCVGRVTACRSFHARNPNSGNDDDDDDAHQPSKQKMLSFASFVSTEAKGTRRFPPIFRAKFDVAIFVITLAILARVIEI